MTRILCIIMAVAAPLALAGARAQAATVTFSFSGTVASIDDPSGLIGPISPGETFTGSFSYETGVPDLNPDPSRGDYLFNPSSTPPFASPLGITFTIGGRTFGPNYSPPAACSSASSTTPRRTSGSPTRSGPANSRASTAPPWPASAPSSA